MAQMRHKALHLGDQRKFSCFGSSGYILGDAGMRESSKRKNLNKILCTKMDAEYSLFFYTPFSAQFPARKTYLDIHGGCRCVYFCANPNCDGARKIVNKIMIKITHWRQISETKLDHNIWVCNVCTSLEQTSV
jgi:hypothetical protein